MQTVSNYFTMKYADKRGNWMDDILYRFRIITFLLKEALLNKNVNI